MVIVFSDKIWVRKALHFNILVLFSKLVIETAFFSDFTDDRKEVTVIHIRLKADIVRNTVASVTKFARRYLVLTFGLTGLVDADVTRWCGVTMIFVLADCHKLRSLKRIVCHLLLNFRLGMDGDELDIHLCGASNLRLCVFTDFYAGFAVGYNDVASYIWFRLNPSRQNTVMTTTVNHIAPNVWSRSGAAIVSCNTDPVLMHLFDFVVQDK